MWNHCIAVGFLQASFEICELPLHPIISKAIPLTSILVHEWLSGQPSTKMRLIELAAMRHKQMAPTKHNSKNLASWCPSPTRIKFCHSIATRAECIAVALSENVEWR